MDREVELFLSHASLTVVALLPVLDFGLIVVILSLEERLQALPVLLSGAVIVFYHHLLLAQRYSQVHPQLQPYRCFLCSRL